MDPLLPVRWAWWVARHPTSIALRRKGLSFRDLVLYEDLKRAGHAFPLESYAGISLTRVSPDTVTRLSRRLGPMRFKSLVDVGAAYGQFSAAACLVFPGITILAFEPLPAAFSVLSRTVGTRRATRSFPFALGADPGELVLHHSRNPGSSSILPMLPSHESAFPGTGTSGETRVKVRRMDDVVAEEGVSLPRPLLVKIDVQGFEDRVLAGGPRTLAMADALIIEMSLEPLYQGQILAGELQFKLESMGFRYEGEYDRILSPVTGQQVQRDGLFLRVEDGSLAADGLDTARQ